MTITGATTTRENVVVALAWVRLVIVTSARALLVMVMGLALWATGPALLGWQVSTVVSESMRPAIAVGDIIIARPTTAEDLQAGQVLLFPDPDHTNRLRLHRYDATTSDGDIISKGDANPHADSSPIHPQDVLGVGVLRVPLLGQPVVWVQTQQWIPLALTALVLLAALVVGVQPPLGRRRHLEISAALDPGAPRNPEPRLHASPRHLARESSRRRIRARRQKEAAIYATIAMVSLLTFIATPSTAAHAAFTASTGHHTSFTAATATPPTHLRCITNLDGTATILWEHPGDAQSFTPLMNGRPTTPLDADVRSMTISLSSLFSWSRQKVSIRSELGGTWNATSSTVTISVFSFLGLGSVRCA